MERWAIASTEFHDWSVDAGGVSNFAICAEMSAHEVEPSEDEHAAANIAAPRTDIDTIKARPALEVCRGERAERQFFSLTQCPSSGEAPRLGVGPRPGLARLRG